MRTDMSGPDFLNCLSEAELSNGLDINAHEYAKRSREWRNDLEAATVARDANDLLTIELNRIRQVAAGAYDALSRVRPHSENLDDYTAARDALAGLADTPRSLPAWAGDALRTIGRDPRTQPMPGDRFYLPVLVSYANYGPGDDVSATLKPIVDGQPVEQTFHVYAVQHAWLLGAIGIVPSTSCISAVPANA